MTVLTPPPEGTRAPHPSLLSEPYWEGCRRHQLLYQRCAACGHTGLRAFSVCAACLATSPTWERSAGAGVLYSWTVVWRAPDPSFVVPYAPAIVRLDEEVWMISAIIGCEPEELHDGMRVAVEFHRASAEITLPYFAPTGR